MADPPSGGHVDPERDRAARSPDDGNTKPALAEAVCRGPPTDGDSSWPIPLSQGGGDRCRDIVGVPGTARKRACPRLHPRSYPHRWIVPRTAVRNVRGRGSGRLADQSEAGTIGQVPALVGTQFEAIEGVIGEEQVAVQVDPLRE